MSLSSLIVQREIATIREVEEALARQVLYGGDLVTNLFEVAHLEEAKVTPLLAEAYGLMHAPIGELPRPLEGTKHLVPVELATARSMIPFGKDGGKLVLLVSEPLPKQAVDELSFALGLDLEQRVAPSFRVRQAIAREYGVPLERRVARLLGRITGEDARMTSSLPPLLRQVPRTMDPPRAPTPAPTFALSARLTPTITTATTATPTTATTPPETRRRNTTITGMPVFAFGLPPAPPLPNLTEPAPPPLLSEPPDTDIERIAPLRLDPNDHDDDTPVRPFPELPVTTQKLAAPRPASGIEPPSPRNSPSGRPVSTATQKLQAQAPRPPSTPLAASAVPSPASPAPTSGAAPVAPALSASGAALAAAPATPATPRMAGSDAPRVTLQRSNVELVARGRRRHGPLTPDAARAELDEASERDAVLQLYFDFARQYFDYAALFSVQGDLAEGRDAFGDGAGRDRVAKIGVPLDLPSVLSLARDEKDAVVAVPSGEGLDRVLMGDLDRVTRGRVLVAPVVVRTRVVALFWGDDGDTGVDDAATTEVKTFAREVGAAFERIILRKKLGAGKQERLEPPAPAAPVEAEPAEAPSKNAPPTVLSPRAHSAPPPDDVSPPVLEVDVLAVPASLEVSSWGAPPSPSSLFQVRKPSGRPIPREEPEREETSESVASSAGARGAQEDVEAAATSSSVAATATGKSAGSEVAQEFAPSSGRLRAANGPESSQAISVPARRPPSARSESQGELPTIIVDVAAEIAELIERVLAGVDPDAEAELLRQGQAAMPALMARFPGPITFDAERATALARSDVAIEPLLRVSECGPLLRIVAGQRKVALPFVLRASEATEREQRFWATFLLTELVYPEAVERIVPRLFDDHPQTRRVARLAARAVAEVAPVRLVERLAEIALSGQQPLDVRTTTVELLGDVRDGAAVPSLMKLLQDADSAIARSAHLALVTVTRQDFGDDQKRWLAWWNAHASHHRIEWLIEALEHEDLRVRNAAGEELKALTKEYFGYYGDLPKRERERAQQRYRDWWATEGRIRFRRG